MKIKLTSVYVDDQEKALRFYTEVLGFVKKADFSKGPFRWLTVASPEDPDGTELQLALNDNPAAKAYQQAMFQQGQPAAMFFTDDVQADYERMKARGCRVHHATDGRDRLQDRHAERHLRQSHSGHATDALVGRRFSSLPGALPSPRATMLEHRLGGGAPPAFAAFDIETAARDTGGSALTGRHQPAAREHSHLFGPKLRAFAPSFSLVSAGYRRFMKGGRNDHFEVSPCSSVSRVPP